MSSYTADYNLHEYSDSFTDFFQSRKDIIKSLQSRNTCDVLVVGGGIHGACCARLSAFNGLNTVLLERNDYASGTSGKSSKMIHGGLRYLELFDFRQVYEGIRARESWFVTAPHLVKREKFHIPIGEADKWLKQKLSLGLKLYSLIAESREDKSRWIPVDKLDKHLETLKGQSLQGCFQYVDGLMNDTRLVIETILAARQEGGRCLNYAEVLSHKLLPQGGNSVGWIDRRTGDKHELVAGIVINCAGPWVPYMGRVKASGLSKNLRYSRGSHLLFNRPWKGPSLLLPMQDRGRYYFVWPHFSGTLVGTNEHETTDIEQDPLPREFEIEEILNRLAKDLPFSGLDRKSLHYCFSGLRTLVLRNNQKGTSKLSRRHLWSYSNGVLSLLGGKFTTAQWTAFEGLKMAFKVAGLKRQLISLKDRPLPGAGGYESAVSEFQKQCKLHNVSDSLCQSTINRLGSRVRHIEGKDGFKLIPGLPDNNSVMQGELELALKMEQAETVEDLMRRRIQVEYLPDHGIAALDFVKNYMSQSRDPEVVANEVLQYRERIQKIKDLCKGSTDSADSS